MIVPERHARTHKKWIPRTGPGTGPGTSPGTSPGTGPGTLVLLFQITSSQPKPVLQDWSREQSGPGTEAGLIESWCDRWYFKFLYRVPGCH